MDLLTQTLKSVLLPLAEALLCALLGYLGIRIRGIYVRFINGREKEAVARIAVQATEQICRELHGKEKLDAALAHMSELLTARGIPFEAKRLHGSLTQGELRLGDNLADVEDRLLAQTVASWAGSLRRVEREGVGGRLLEGYARGGTHQIT